MVAERDEFLEAVTDDDSAPMLAFIKRHVSMETIFETTKFAVFKCF